MLRWKHLQLVLSPSLPSTKLSPFRLLPISTFWCHPPRSHSREALSRNEFLLNLTPSVPAFQTYRSRSYSDLSMYNYNFDVFKLSDKNYYNQENFKSNLYFLVHNSPSFIWKIVMMKLDMSVMPSMVPMYNSTEWKLAMIIVVNVVLTPDILPHNQTPKQSSHSNLIPLQRRSRTDHFQTWIWSGHKTNFFKLSDVFSPQRELNTKFLPMPTRPFMLWPLPNSPASFLTLRSSSQPSQDHCPCCLPPGTLFL